MYLTRLQKQEMLDRIDIRIDTVEEDPHSGSEIELIPHALRRLEEKIHNNFQEPATKMELEWMKIEAEDLLRIAESNAQYEGPVHNGRIRSMQTLIDKIERES